MSLFHSFFSIKHIAFILLILCHLQHYHPSHSSRSLILSKFGFVFKSFAFGIIEGHESSFTCLNSNELQTNNKSFTFWQCDTNELLHQNIVLPYVPSSIAFNDFIILSDFTLRNWKPQTLHKASFLSNTTVLQRISLLLFDRIKHLTQTVSDMQRTISRHEAEIVNLKSQLANKHRLYIVCTMYPIIHHNTQLISLVFWIRFFVINFVCCVWFLLLSISFESALH